MALTSSAPTIIDAMQKNKHPGGEYVSEVLQPTNFMGGPIPVKVAMEAATPYQVYQQLPTSYQRKFNNGVDFSLTTPIDRIYQTYEHDDYLPVDRAILKRLKKSGASMEQEWKEEKRSLILEGRFWRVDFNTIYGQSAETAKSNDFFPDYAIDSNSAPGIYAMMDDLGLTGTSFVTDVAGGTTAQRSSALFLHASTTRGLHYLTLEGMNFSGNWNPETLTGINSKPLKGEELWIHGDWGLATNYRYFAFRIKGLTSDSGKTMTYDRFRATCLNSRLATGRNPNICLINPTQYEHFMDDISTLNLNVVRVQDERNIVILDGVTIVETNALMHGETV